LVSLSIYLAQKDPFHDASASGKDAMKEQILQQSERPGSGEKQGPRYVEALTGLRGVAAMFVFLFHYAYFNPAVDLRESIPLVGTVFQFPFDFGFMGVDLFFVLSGFLLSLPFARHAQDKGPAIDLKRYFRRRVLRVFPAYYVQLFLVLLAGTWFVVYKPLSGTTLAAHLVMFFNIGSEPIRPMIGVWWTLPVEFSFYLLLPLLALIMKPRRWIAAIPLIAASVAYRAWAAGQFDNSNVLMLVANHLPGSLPEFLLGATAAIITQRFDHSKLASGRWLDVCLLVSIGLVGAWFLLVVGPNGEVYWQGHWSMIIAPCGLGMVLTLLVWSVYNGSRLGRALFSNRVVHFLGLISYSLYLWHFVVMQQMIMLWPERFGNMTGIPKFLMTMAAVCGCLDFLLVCGAAVFPTAPILPKKRSSGVEGNDRAIKATMASVAPNSPRYSPS